MYARNDGNRPLQSPSGSSCPRQDRPYLESASVVPLCLSFRHLSFYAQYSRSTPVSEIQHGRRSSRARSWKRLEASWLSFLHTRQPLSGPQQRTRGFGRITAVTLQDLRSWGAVMPLILDLPYAGSFSLVWVSSAKLSPTALLQCRLLPPCPLSLCLVSFPFPWKWLSQRVKDLPSATVVLAGKGQQVRSSTIAYLWSIQDQTFQFFNDHGICSESSLQTSAGHIALTRARFLEARLA